MHTLRLLRRFLSLDDHCQLGAGMRTRLLLLLLRRSAVLLVAWQHPLYPVSAWQCQLLPAGAVSSAVPLLQQHQQQSMVDLAQLLVGL
jgi:hypothetical protein